MTETAVANPFHTTDAQGRRPPASVDVAVQRELAEVQAAVLMARRFPRDPVRAMDTILVACTRVTLAQSALYQYARGGTDISGPSIRLAEAMAQTWGNLTFGIRELEQRSGESTMEAYAWDMETNVRQSRVFQVRHERYTRERSYKLTDPRDIYEQNANQGARRLRACILGVIPGDVVEAAVQQCEATLVAEADTSAAGIKKMIDSFAQFGVTQPQIEARCQRHAEAIRPAQIVQLRKIWASLNDGMSEPADWFEPAAPPKPAPAAGNQGLRERLAGKRHHKLPQAQPQGSAHGGPTEEETEAALDSEANPTSPDRPREAGVSPQPPEGAPSADRPPIDVATPVATSAAPSPGPFATGERLPAEIDEEGAPEPEFAAIQPKRLARRSGWDWKEFVDEVIANAPERDQMQAWRVANARMIDTLRISNKDEWSRLQQALAEHEREGTADG